MSGQDPGGRDEVAPGGGVVKIAGACAVEGLFGAAAR